MTALDTTEAAMFLAILAATFAIACIVEHIMHRRHVMRIERALQQRTERLAELDRTQHEQEQQ